MYSAAHIFFYGAIRYIFDNKYKGLLIAASSVLMHFSFLFPIIVLAVYPFVKQKNNLLFILFIISIFITELNLTEVRTFLTANLPYIFHDEIKSYTNVNYAEARFSKVLSWHALLYRKILNWTITAYLFYIYFKGRQTLNNNLKLLNLFSFSLLILTSANIVSNIPSGARFLSVANLFAMAMIYLFVEKTENKSLSSLRQITLPFLLFFCIVAIRDVGLDTIGLRTILSNPLTAIFFVDDIPLIDLIK